MPTNPHRGQDLQNSQDEQFPKGNLVSSVNPVYKNRRWTNVRPSPAFS